MQMKQEKECQLIEDVLRNRGFENTWCTVQYLVDMKAYCLQLVLETTGCFQQNFPKSFK